MGVSTEHPDYILHRYIWQRIRDVLGGEDAVKARAFQNQGQAAALGVNNYLPALNGQTPADYNAYLGRAVFYNATVRTLDGLTGAVFRVDPEIELTPDMEPLREDCDRRGTPLHLFAKMALREVLAMGRYGVLVDLPMVGMPAGTIPYFCGYVTENIINWRVEEIDYAPRLTRVVLREFFTEPDPKDEFADLPRCRYRVCELVEGVYRVRVFRPLVDENGQERYDTMIEEIEPVIPMRRGEALTQIPFVFIGPQGLDPGIQRSPLLDLVNLNLHHFRMSAERRNGLFVSSMPQPVIIGDTSQDADTGRPLTRRIGAAVAWELAAGASAMYLETSNSGGLAELRGEMLDDEARMVLLGASLLEPHKRASETAEALRLRQAGDSATLATVADSVSWGLTVALGYAAQWLGADPDKNYITLSQEFAEVIMSEDDANKLIARWQMGGATVDDVYYLLKKGGRIEPEQSQAEWQLKLEAEPPLPPALPPGASSPMDEEAAA